MMNLLVLVGVLGVLIVVSSHPTMYKMNDKKLLEPDLVPVSSTVIPLPIYQVSSSFNVAPSKDEKTKPVGPISLITTGNKKKSYPKPKSDDVSIVKEVTKKEFIN